MKTSQSIVRNLQSKLGQSRVSRPFSSSSCFHDASVEAESSSSSRPGKGKACPGESAETAWKRNLNEAREWRKHRASSTADIPFFLPPSSKPLPKRTPTQLTLSTLLASGAALGHSTSLLAPPFLPYVYGNRSGLSVIDLDQTLPILRRTAALVRDVVKADGVVLIVGTREGHKKAVEKARERLGDNGFAVTDKWLPGTLTNSQTFFGLQPLMDGAYKPDLAIFLNPSENVGAINECTARNVPTVGIVDSDTDPRIVTYPIPANMESLRTAELIVGTLSIAGQEGRRMRVLEAETKKREEGNRKRPVTRR
ncbi:small subunit ribosomal protein S2, partial [Tremellales sp. Uapishka_1]